MCFIKLKLRHKEGPALMEWLAPSPHSGFDSRYRAVLWDVWGPFGFSGFLPHSKDVQLRLKTTCLTVMNPSFPACQRGPAAAPLKTSEELDFALLVRMLVFLTNAYINSNETWSTFHSAVWTKNACWCLRKEPKCSWNSHQGPENGLLK